MKPLLPENSWAITDPRPNYQDFPSWFNRRYGGVDNFNASRVLKQIDHDLRQLNRLDSYYRETNPVREQNKKVLQEMKLYVLSLKEVD